MPSDQVQMYGSAELEALMVRGVHLPAPHLVAIARDVPLEAIAPGAVLHPFTRLSGARTRIDAGAVLGEGGAATVHDSWVGAQAEVATLGPVTMKQVTLGPRGLLGCGVAEDAVFLGREAPEPGFTTGYGFRVRRGSLYEEDANSAQHTDTKMTILFPWVTLGSNINWCDILVAGGTGPQTGNFSEIGSGAVHFNFSPRGDKASATVLGDVTAGVFLDQARVFIGGNSSLVGPLRGAFGAVSPAGGRMQRDLRKGMNLGAPPPQESSVFDLEVYGSIHRLYTTQVRMIGQLAALDGWYGHIRAWLARGDSDRTERFARGRAVVQSNLRERVTQLTALAERIEDSVRVLEAREPSDPRLDQHRAFLTHWPALEGRLLEFDRNVIEPPPELTGDLERQAERHGESYTRTIQALSPQAVDAGRKWLEMIAASVATQEVLAAVPQVQRSL